MIRVVAGIIERRGKLLICQRRRGGMFGLQWEFPGGKLRPCETPRAGLARELREELGMEVRVGARVWRTRHRYSQFPAATEITFFVIESFRPSPGNLEFERIEWVQPCELPRYDFLAADRALVAKLARGELRVDAKPKRDSSLRETVRSARSALRSE